MPIKIYNTLTHQKEEFIPLEPNKVKMYVCGPTVYNHIHIGNTRPAIFFDTVRRYLQFKGYEVNYATNFTDVDDRIIAAANETGKTAKEVAEMFIDSYHQHTEQLGVCRADHHPTVTETMPEIIRFINELIENELAYESGGDVYYRTKKFENYGKLSHQKTEDLLEGVRIETDEKKESALDFVLWKKAKPNEVSWESPWGHGRPGWHIECSAMIKKFLGETIDIHGGGLDLIFPHHENEIAQTEGLTHKPVANYWMHNAMLLINEQKMSKSLGNFVRVDEVLKHHDPGVVRFFMLSGHYRTPLTYSDQLLEQAKNGYDRLKTTVSSLEYRLDSALDGEASNDIIESVKEWKDKFTAAMDDDFNTAKAISVMFELSREINSYLHNEQVKIGEIKLYKEMLLDLAELLGLQLKEEKELLDQEIEQLIEDRDQARQEKDFSRADQIRDMLAEQGIVLEDTPQGVRWRRK
jgi:cysteinyl-tRNA synthetase